MNKKKRIKIEIHDKKISFAHSGRRVFVPLGKYAHIAHT